MILLYKLYIVLLKVSFIFYNLCSFHIRVLSDIIVGEKMTPRCILSINISTNTKKKKNEKCIGAVTHCGWSDISKNVSHDNNSNFDLFPMTVN